MTRRAQPERVAVRNAGDVGQVKRAHESDRAKAERERNEDAAVWGTYTGRAFLRRVLAECGVYRLSMANDSHWTAFNEGARNIGLQLMARMLATAPELYALMEQEHVARGALEPSAPESPDQTDTAEDIDG